MVLIGSLIRGWHFLAKMEIMDAAGDGDKEVVCDVTHFF